MFALAATQPQRKDAKKTASRTLVRLYLHETKLGLNCVIRLCECSRQRGCCIPWWEVLFGEAREIYEEIIRRFEKTVSEPNHPSARGRRRTRTLTKTSSRLMSGRPFFA